MCCAERHAENGIDVPPPFTALPFESAKRAFSQFQLRDYIYGCVQCYRHHIDAALQLISKMKRLEPVLCFILVA
jgi:hypothetical protein